MKRTIDKTYQPPPYPTTELAKGPRVLLACSGHVLLLLLAQAEVTGHRAAPAIKLLHLSYFGDPWAIRSREV
jgi:hypothetical protein